MCRLVVLCLLGAGLGAGLGAAQDIEVGYNAKKALWFNCTAQVLSHICKYGIQASGSR